MRLLLLPCSNVKAMPQPAACLHVSRTALVFLTLLVPTSGSFVHCCPNAAAETVSPLLSLILATRMQVEELDLAMRKKDKDSALAKLAVAKANLDSVIAKVL